MCFPSKVTDPGLGARGLQAKGPSLLDLHRLVCQPVFFSFLCRCLWVNCFSTPSLSFLFYKVGVSLVTSQTCREGYM